MLVDTSCESIFTSDAVVNSVTYALSVVESNIPNHKAKYESIRINFDFKNDCFNMTCYDVL